MDLQAEKIELAKRLLDTEDESVVKAVKNIFTNSDYEASEWNDLPDKVIADVKESIQQLNAGKGIPHSEVQGSWKKWL